MQTTDTQPTTPLRDLLEKLELDQELIIEHANTLRSAAYYYKGKEKPKRFAIQTLHTPQGKKLKITRVK